MGREDKDFEKVDCSRIVGGGTLQHNNNKGFDDDDDDRQHTDCDKNMHSSRL